MSILFFILWPAGSVLSQSPHQERYDVVLARMEST